MQMKHLNDSEQPRAGVTSAYAVLRSVYVTQRQVNYVGLLQKRRFDCFIVVHNPYSLQTSNEVKRMLAAFLLQIESSHLCEG